KHLKILEECGIVEVSQQGRERTCLMHPESLVPAFMWIEQYQKLWENRLDSFEQYLNELQINKKKDESDQ
ncbi:MAG: transcriptional regulator, partial [Bacteroidota bacterium]